MFMINNRANRCSFESNSFEWPFESQTAKRLSVSDSGASDSPSNFQLGRSNFEPLTSNLQLAHNNKLQLTQWSWVLLLIFLLWKCVQHRIGITDEFVLNLTWAKFRLAGDSQSLPAMGSAVWSPESSEGSRVRSLLSQKFWQKRSSGLILAN